MIEKFPSELDSFLNQTVDGECVNSDTFDTHVLVQLVIELTVVVLGLISNASFWVVLVFSPRTRKGSTYWYLLSLSIADTLFLLMRGSIDAVVQFRLGPFNSPVLPFECFSSSLTCPFFPISSFLPLYSSIEILCVIAAERYVGVVYPFKTKEWNNPSSAIKVIILTWIIALVLTVPEVLLQCSHHYDFVKKMSTLTTALHVLTWLPFITALVIITVLYSIIRHYISLRNRDLKSISSASEQVQDESRAVTKMLLITTVVFFVCVTPSICSLIINTLLWLELVPSTISQTLSFEIYQTTCHLFLFVNSSINPILYHIYSAKYRQTFREIFFACSPFRRAFSSYKHKTSCNTKNFQTVSRSSVEMTGKMGRYTTKKSSSRI